MSDGYQNTPSDIEASASVLRAIRDSATSTAAEKISASKELRMLLGQGGADGDGPGIMSRDEIHSELARLQALTSVQPPDPAQPLRTRKGQAVGRKGKSTP